MRHYESMFIVQPTLNEQEIKSKIDFYKDVIAKNGGEIEGTLDMGMRQLAYEIKKRKRGYYYVIYFKAPRSSVLELERLFRINEDILRFIIIKFDSVSEQKKYAELVARSKKGNEPKDGKKLDQNQEANKQDLESKAQSNSTESAQAETDKNV